MKKLFITVFCSVLCLAVNNAQGGDKVRQSILAGSWYPASADALRKTVDDYIGKANPDLSLSQKRVIALISPHAGYQYSGQAAAYGYKLLKGNQDIKRVIILAPSHHFGFRGLSILDVDAYETPLGTIPVDKEAADKLRQYPLIQSIAQAHAREHSIEIQLPFIQRTLKNFKLVPIIVGQLRSEDFELLSKALKPFVDDTTLIVASSDFTHYGHNFGYLPFYDDIKNNLANLDGKAVSEIIAEDFNGFRSYIKKTGITICGRDPISLLLKLVPANSTAKQLIYYTSGDVTGDYTNSVSYVSIVFTVENKTAEKTEKENTQVEKDQDN
ncbi:AmmeMemoRadiSam system protein B [bacterium]|nr:AmmeMemoRadiSam system protein B [bacterium]